jgi:hypothetical protein
MQLFLPDQGRNKMLHVQTVSPELLALTRQFMQDEKFQDFRLVGGTALALQIGHRESIDIDLFSNRPFDASSLRDHINSNYPTEISGEINNGVSTRINGIQIDMIAHQYPWIKPPVVEDRIRMASPDDIAAMKRNAIYRNGNRRKDFVDIYILLGKMTLNEILLAHQQKYPDVISSISKESVRTFNRLEPGTKIKLLEKTVPWIEIKKRLNDAVKNPDKIFKPDLLSLLPKKRISTKGHKKKPRL